MIVAIIPARGGSKGLPGKNIRPLAGKPLLAHTIAHARQATAVDAVYVTTDDAAIAAVARQYGAAVIDRPAALSGDGASSESALLHALDVLAAGAGRDPELVVFLQCTSPIRRPADIDGAIATLRAESADSLLSVVPSHHWIWRRSADGPTSLNFDYHNRPRRQERPAEFDENGSIYVFKPAILRQTGNRLGGKIALYPMPYWSHIDIDAAEDLALAEWVLRREDDPHDAT